MTKIIFKNEHGDGGEYCKSWGVYFEGQEDKFDTIILAWADDTDIYVILYSGLQYSYSDSSSC
jgi:hypothetical protein